MTASQLVDELRSPVANAIYKYSAFFYKSHKNIHFEPTCLHTVLQRSPYMRIILKLALCVDVSHKYAAPD
jgi:hypothetical protein